MRLEFAKKLRTCKEIEKEFQPRKNEEDLVNLTTSGKKKKCDEQTISETNAEKLKMELLKHRVQEIVTKYPFFTKAKQFFARMLRVGIA